MIELSDFSVADLLRLHAHLGEELRRRGVARSSNNPTGDVAEHLFCRAFGWKQAGNSTPNIDAIGSDETRYQIKGRRITRHNTSRQLSAIRDLADKHFDYLAGVLFDECYGVFRAAIVPRAIVETHATYVQRTNSHRFILRDEIWSVVGVRDVTADLRGVEL